MRNTITNTVIDNPNTEHRLLWDVMKSNIREATISQQCSINKSDNIEIEVLNSEITNIEQKLANISFSNENSELELELAKAKHWLNEIFEKRHKVARLRKNLQNYEEGEKPSKYFLSLEKGNREKRRIKN